MNGGPVIVVYAPTTKWSERLSRHLPDHTVLHVADGGDLGRILTSGHRVEALVSAIVDGDRDWQRLSLIHDRLPALHIVALLDGGAGWSGPADRRPAELTIDGGVSGIGFASAIISLLNGRSSVDDRPLPSSEDEGRTIAVIGLGGGVGTTSVATVLATTASTSSSLIVADLDGRHNALAAVFRVNPTYGTGDLRTIAHDAARLDEAVPVCLTPITSETRLLAANGDGHVRDTAADLAIIRALSRQATDVVVDFGELSSHHIASVATATDVVLVCSQDIVVARRVPAMVDLVRRRATAARCWTVLNGVRRDSGPSPDSMAEAFGVEWDVVLPWSSSIRREWNAPRHTGRPSSTATNLGRRLSRITESHQRATRAAASVPRDDPPMSGGLGVTFHRPAGAKEASHA